MKKKFSSTKPQIVEVPRSLGWQVSQILSAVHAEPKEAEFFRYLVARLFQAPWVLKSPDYRGAEIPSQTIDRLFGTRFSTASLAEKKLIEIAPYSTSKNECKAYLISPEISNALLASLREGTESIAKVTKFNLMSGEPVPKSPRQVGYGSALMRDAAKVFEGCPFSAAGLDMFIDDSFAASLRDPGLEGRFRNDLLCATQIRMRSTLGLSGYTYSPSYTGTSTGRFAEVGGGFQSCSREMKVAALASVPNMHNYDLRSSQAFVLLQELENAKLERAFLAEYLATPDAAAEYAETLGISRDSFKQCLYATVMGAAFSTLQVAKRNSLYRILESEFPDEREALAKLIAVQKTLTPLRKILASWHKTIIDNKRLKNACGLALNLADVSPFLQKKCAAAFILQGQESAFIHHLTIIAKSYGFTPLSNQHDGLVTHREIPIEAVEKAKELSGFRLAILDEKPSFGV